jgi:hypothetical protein
MSTFLLSVILQANAQEPSQNTRLLRAPEAQASSFLFGGYNRHLENYHPNYVLDENPRTAWLEGAAGFGEGEWLSIPIVSPAPLSSLRLRIRNGYQKSQELLEANAAPKKVRLSLLDRSGNVVAEVEHSLQRIMGWQQLDIPLKTPSELAVFRLEVVSVHPGRVYKDGCISDIQLIPDSSAPYDVAVQDRRHAMLSRWIGERQEDAAADSGRPDLFASAVYIRQEAAEKSWPEAKKEMKPFRQRFRASSKSGQWYRVESVRKPAVRPGKLDEMEGFIDLVHADLFAVAEASKRLRTYEKNYREEGSVYYENLKSQTNFTASFHDEEKRRPEMLARSLDAMDAEGTYMRGLTIAQKEDQLALYDEQGRLMVIWKEKKYLESSDDESETITEELVRLSYSAKGQVERIEVLRSSLRHSPWRKKINASRVETYTLVAKPPR